jgi:hypothetical protein
MKTNPKIFLCYAREDKEKVAALYQKLRDEGFAPWMDEAEMLAGAHLAKIKKAIQTSDFFLPCPSSNWGNRRGFYLDELRDAMKIVRELSVDYIWLIPVRLEICDVPNELKKFIWINLYEEDGFMKLKKTIQAVMIERTKTNKNHWKKKTPKQSQGKKYAKHEKAVPANPNIFFEEDRVLVEVYKEKRIVKHYYRLRAMKEVDRYKFKFTWGGSGEVRVNSESEPGDNLIFIPDMNLMPWRRYTLLFAKPLKRGGTKEVALTYEILDENHNASSFQTFSYTHVAGCNKLSIRLAFADPTIVDTVYFTEYDSNWEVLNRKKVIPIKTKNQQNGIREYLIERQPESVGLRHHIEWQLAHVVDA